MLPTNRPLLYPLLNYNASHTVKIVPHSVRRRKILGLNIFPTFSLSEIVNVVRSFPTSLDMDLL